KKKWQSTKYLNKIVVQLDDNADGYINYGEFREWFMEFLDYGAPERITRESKLVKVGKGDDGSRIVNGYTIIKKIGSGSYGTVRLCMHSNTNKAYAVKILRKKQLSKIKVKGGTALDSVLREISILKTLHHPNLVK